MAGSQRRPESFDGRVLRWHLLEHETPPYLSQNGDASRAFLSYEAWRRAHPDQRPETVAVILAAANRLHLVDDPDVDRRIGHAGYARNRRRRRPAPSPRNGDQSDGFEGDGAELQPSRPAGPDRHSRLAHDPHRLD